MYDLLQNEDLYQGCFIKDLKLKFCKKSGSSSSKMNINFRLRTTRSNLPEELNNFLKISFTFLLGNLQWPMMMTITWGRWAVCLIQSRDIYSQRYIQIHSPAASALTVKQLAKYFPLSLHLPANSLKMHYNL